MSDAGDDGLEVVGLGEVECLAEPVARHVDRAGLVAGEHADFLRRQSHAKIYAQLLLVVAQLRILLKQTPEKSLLLIADLPVEICGVGGQHAVADEGADVSDGGIGRLVLAHGFHDHSA